MTNQRSPLDNLNMRRERRPLASLEELNRTLSALENHLAGRREAEDYSRHTQAADETVSPGALEFLRTDPVAASHTQTASVSADNPHKEALAAIADELQRLRARTELRQAVAISEKLQPSETGVRHNPARLSAADRFIAGTSTLSANNSPNTDAVMRRDFEELKRTVETLAREESLRRMSHRWDALDERFDSFEQQQTEKFHASQSAHIDPALDAITTRLDDLRHAIEQLPDNQSHSLRQLDERLDEISRAILATSYHRQQPEQENAVFEELDRRFADLTSHLDEQYRNSVHKTALNDDRFIQALESRLDLITRQVSEQTAALQAVPAAPAADQQLMRNLEKQLGFITEQLSKPENLLPELAEIKPRLDVIERAIDINRDTVLSAAREAAEEAIRQVVDKGPSRDTDFARQLADDLKALEQLTRDTDERNNRTFNKVHDTLLKIAERLGQIEKDNLQKPPFAQPSRSAGQSREQNNATRFTSQFSIPEWGNDPEQAAGNSPRNTAFSAVPSPAAAAIEAARAAVKSAANPVPEKMAADTEAETTGTTRKSLLSGLAQAVRRSKPNEPAAAAADAFQIEDTDLLTLDTPSAANRMPVKSEEESTDQTLAAMPDLNAIIRRVRDEQRGRGPDHNPAAGKSDLISAARRAAQAAADETGRLRDQNLSDSTLAGDITSDEDRTTAADKPKRSLRKPLLLAIGAIIIAVTGLQLGNTYLTEKQDSVVPQSPDLASVQPAPVNTAPAVIEDKKPALPTITTLDNPAQSEEQTASTLQITSLNHGPVYDGTEAQPLGSREFPTEPLSARPMTGSTQAVIKPVVINPPVASAPDIQPLPELPANNTPVVTAQAETAIPDQMTTQSLPQKSEAAATAKLTAVPAVPKEAGPIALRNAAESGDARALYEIGMRYTDGRGVGSDFAEAAKWYALSAERGFAPAQFRLANFNEKGLGMPRDAAKATQLYEQSAAQGNASAMHNLAVLYAMGPDGKADHDNAAKWFFRAAELGVKDSQYNLGILTAKGLGRTQNLEESYKWFALAANAGDTDAADKRDQIAKSLKPEQLERAMNLTKLWKPKDMIEDANSVSIPDAWADDKAVTTASVDMKKAVRNIQLILQKNGYDAGTADGVMGNKTRDAISAFQKANGMKPTGEVDQKLVEALLAKNS